MTQRLRKGQIIACHFLDHVEDSREPLPFVVWGRLVRADRQSITIASWDYENGKARGMKDENRKLWTIVRTCITRIEQLAVNGKA